MILGRNTKDVSNGGVGEDETLRENGATTQVRLVHDWAGEGRGRFGRKKKVERRKSVLDYEYKRHNDPRRSISSVRESERRSLFRSIHVRIIIGTSVKHLCQDVERRR